MSRPHEPFCHRNLLRLLFVLGVLCLPPFAIAMVPPICLENEPCEFDPGTGPGSGYCGDLTCSGGESCSSCSEDCGECPIDTGGGGTYTPPPSFDPPPPPYYTAPTNLYVYYQYNHSGWQGCNQVAHVWVGGGSDVTRGTTLYGAGIAVPNSRVHFGFYNAAGTLVKTHLSQEVRSNCVLHHEPEAISTWDLAPGYYYIYASYWGLSPYINPIFFDFSGYATYRQGSYISPLRIR